MEITVKMTTDEFLEFMEYRKDKGAANRRERVIANKMENLAEKVFAALEECGETDTPEFRIKSQDATTLLVEAAAEIFA